MRSPRRKPKSEEERARAHAASQRTDVSGMRFNVVPVPGTPRYDGILLRSIAINFLSGPEVQRVWQAFMPRPGLNRYAGEQGQTYHYSAIVSSRRRPRA